MPKDLNNKVVIRFLRYSGPPEWIESTMARNAIKGGVNLTLGGQVATIQELVLPNWLAKILDPWLRRRPMATPQGWDRGGRM